MKEKILKELLAREGEYVSGEELRKKFLVSRTAIWKHIKTLKEEGYEIETVNRKGYRLKPGVDWLIPEMLERMIKTKAIGKKIIHFNTIDSTNNYAKKVANEVEHGTLIISEEQTVGRGRMGRNWTSPKGEGIWMSIILKPQIPPTEGSKLTQIAAAAVCIAIRQIIGLEAEIKWPNDIVIGGKKSCGILTEMAGELNAINYLVVGIGINVNVECFPRDLSEKATSLALEKGFRLDRKSLVARILNEFEELYEDYMEKGNLDKTLIICRKYSALIGKEIKIIQGNRESKGIALDIATDGALRVKMEDGKKIDLMSGEISVRGRNGYI